MSIPVEIIARVGTEPGRLIGRTTITDPLQADRQVASLLRALADELDRPTRDPQVLGDLLPDVLADIAASRVPSPRLSDAAPNRGEAP